MEKLYIGNNAVSRAIEVLQEGGVVVMPTDTVYGIVGDARKEGTVEKIARMKARSRKKTFLLFVRDIAMANELALIQDSYICFLERIWPGKVTAILRIKNYESRIKEVALSDRVMQRGTVAVRVSGHPLLKAIFEQVDFPLAQTSANISGDPAASSFEEAGRFLERAQELPDLVIDGGSISSAPSTIIDLSKGALNLVREGAVSFARLKELFHKCGLG